MLTGRKACLSSEPATRSLETSTGLIELMPPWMKVLSPQLTTWRPNRTVAWRPPIVKSWKTKASRMRDCVPTRLLAALDRFLRSLFSKS